MNLFMLNTHNYCFQSLESTHGPYARTLPDGTEVVDIEISQNTPGSIGLVSQAILPYLIFSGHQFSSHLDSTLPIRLTITGGTNVSNSPSYDYMSQVLIPMLSVIGLPPIRISIVKRGWSTGSVVIGNVTFLISPLAPGTSLPAFNLAERGAITLLSATIIAPKSCEKHFTSQLESTLSRRFPDMADVSINFEDSRHEKRFYLLLVATSNNGVKIGRDWLYSNKIHPGRWDKAISYLIKQVIDELAEEIEHEGCVDQYMRDQLAVYQALASGKTRVFGGRRGPAGDFTEPSLHTKTAWWVTSEILGVRFQEDGTCDGIGLIAGEGFKSVAIEIEDSHVIT
jgi:RNA 3'-terminal phosphate cyclase (ATP)